MISREDIQKLAKLARIKLKDAEVDKLTSEVAGILDYLSVIKEVAPDSAFDGGEAFRVLNVLRADENPHLGGIFTEKILKSAPESERGYLKVKKIL